MSTLDHYAALVRHLPASDLAKAAARRAYRSARQALYRRRSSLSTAQLLKGFGIDSEVELPARVLDQRAGQSWCEPSRRDSVLRALAQVPGLAQLGQVRAELAYHRVFDIFGTKVMFGAHGHTDWSLDRVAGQRFPLVPSSEIALDAGGMDPKSPWVMGRLDHLIALGQGYWLAETEEQGARFVRAFIDETIDFLSANPVGVGIHWTCSMETALRGANLAQALVMFSRAPEVRDPGFLLLVLRALSQHADHVEAHLEDHQAVPNNHLIANYVGLLVMCLLFPELPSSAQHVARASNGLVVEMDRQVHPDGVDFEGSIPYHRLVLELFTLAHLTATGCGVTLGSRFTDRLEQMFVVARAYTSSRGLAPQIGDNDSGRALPFTLRPSLEQGYLASIGAALFCSPSLKGEGEAFTEEAAWLLGAEGLASFQAVPAGARDEPFLSREGGLAVLRGAGALVAASVGLNGQRGIGGHSHNDKLSFELHLDGVPVIVDPGTATYSRDAAQRNAFRSTRAHNTVQIDFAEQAPIDPARLFSLTDHARAHVELFHPGPVLDRLTARHLGYTSLPAPVEVERTWVLDKMARALCVSEGLEGKGHHTVTLRLHLPDTEARLRDASDAEWAAACRVVGAPNAFSATAVELGPVGAPRAVLLFEVGLDPTLEAAEYSPGYAQVHPALAVVVQRGTQVPARWSWVVLFGRGPGRVRSPSSTSISPIRERKDTCE